MEILEILYKEKGLLMEMLDTLKTEKQVLINDDVKKLEEIVKKEEELKSQIDSIEKLRIEKCGNKRLKDILPLFKGSEREEIEALGREIENAVSGIQEINNINSLLIKQSLNYIRSVMNMLTPKGVKVYNSTGTVNGSASSSGIFDTSA